MKHGLTCLALLALGALLCIGCGRNTAEAEHASTTDHVELILYCGAGIRPAAAAVIEAYTATRSVTINTTYAGSGRLLGQISAMQKGDLFMPGAELYVDTAITNGLADAESKTAICYFIPVIMVQPGNPMAIRKLQDLLKPGLRVGLGDERVCAIGKRSVRILAKNAVDMNVLRPNIVFTSATVNELGAALQMRTVDAVILWDATAHQFAEYGEVIAIPPADNIPSTIPVVVLTCSEQPEQAAAFVSYLQSDTAKRILAEQGYATDLPAFH